MTGSRARDLAAYRDDPDLVVYEYGGPGDDMRVRRELEGRRWAAEHGIPTAETVAFDPAFRWLVSRRVEDEAEESMAYVEAALEMAQRIARLPTPRFSTEGGSWQTPPRGRLRRALLLARHGIRPDAFLAARSAALGLGHSTTVHNDYNRQNVLNSVATAGHVTIVDWEFTGVGPPHHDMLRLIVDLQDPGLARSAWDLLVSTAPRSDHAALSAQFRWLAIRTLGSEVIVPRRDRNLPKTAHRKARVELAHTLADELDAS